VAKPRPSNPDRSNGPSLQHLKYDAAAGPFVGECRLDIKFNVKGPSRRMPKFQSTAPATRVSTPVFILLWLVTAPTAALAALLLDIIIASSQALNIWTRRRGYPVAHKRRGSRVVPAFLAVPESRKFNRASRHPHRHASERDRIALPGARSFVVDLERGIFYRKQIGKRATGKRQTPAPVPPRLLAHMRLKPIARCFVESNGTPVASGKKGFRSAVGLARITGKITPHRLPHMAATWLMRRGVPGWEAAFSACRPRCYWEPTGHHHPGFLHGAAIAIASMHRVSVGESVVELENARETRQKA
jgi:hypothetical protein